MSNLSNEQQATIIKSQQSQKRLVSIKAAQNSAPQYNDTSENQTNQCIESLNASVSQFNAQQANAMGQFNASQKNAAEARRTARDAEARKIEAQLQTQVEQFNATQEFNREQFNVRNATAIAQSNVQWRRQANTADTAANNAANKQNAQTAYNLSVASKNFL